MTLEELEKRIVVLEKKVELLGDKSFRDRPLPIPKPSNLQGETPYSPRALSANERPIPESGKLETYMPKLIPRYKKP